MNRNIRLSPGEIDSQLNRQFTKKPPQESIEITVFDSNGQEIEATAKTVPTFTRHLAGEFHLQVPKLSRQFHAATWFDGEQVIMRVLPSNARELEAIRIAVLGHDPIFAERIQAIIGNRRVY